MPKREDINKIMIIGSGPIRIGQACEFDYSGTQACRVLRQEGYSVVLINSNPATIMTDSEFADKTYIEPITLEVVAAVIEKEVPDAILPTLGGQTGLNITTLLFKSGLIDRFGIEVIGSGLDSIEKAESRDKFRKIVNKANLEMANSKVASSLDEAVNFALNIGFPLVIRSSFMMGGEGSRVIHSYSDLKCFFLKDLGKDSSSQVVLEKSLIGWKEYELELMRDCQDNVVVVCTIENIDSMGIHTGDSMTVSPIQTLTDREYQSMRDAAISIIREVGVNTGGANVQFAVNPKTGEMLVVEMNPRVSRSSALASKATGFPIAKIATKLAVGYTLDEIINDITGKTLACFEPAMDYCVVKIPVWDFDKFSKAENYLTTVMKSVGETMAIGRTFKEAVQKAMRALGTGSYGFGINLEESTSLYKTPKTVKEVVGRLKIANSNRLLDIYHAFRVGMDVESISRFSKIDPWFIFQFSQIFRARNSFRQLFNKKESMDGQKKLEKCHKNAVYRLKEKGFSDVQISDLIQRDESYVSKYRQLMDINPVYKAVDTCAAEFDASSPYYYSTYETECEIMVSSTKKKVVVLGSGPNRIGQGIEFDYCCVHASLALREEGIQSIMINSNPETVSTDYDVSDRLYFEPLTFEDVMNVVRKERPDGVITQFGGQIPLNLSKLLERSGVSILGTRPVDIHRAEDRGLFKELLDRLKIKHPSSIPVFSIKQAICAAKLIGYPLMIRPSFVLGGKALAVVRDFSSLKRFVSVALSVSRGKAVLIDQFLEDATEIDVDVISDGKNSVICGVMEHIEETGIHSGDSACVLPPQNIDSSMFNKIVKTTKIMTKKLKIIGFLNLQYAIKDNELYILEANPRASRSIPFVSKTIGILFPKIATKVMLGKSLSQLDVDGLFHQLEREHVAVKESVFPFDRFINSDVLLGPVMKSTGEVMGIGSSFESAYAKTQMAIGSPLPVTGIIFVASYIYGKDKRKDLFCLINRFKNIGFDIATERDNSLASGTEVKFAKIFYNHAAVIAAIETGKIQLIITIDRDSEVSVKSGFKIRRAALRSKIPYFTTISGANAAYNSIKYLSKNKIISVEALQAYHN